MITYQEDQDLRNNIAHEIRKHQNRINIAENVKKGENWFEYQQQIVSNLKKLKNCPKNLL